jgi:hypothetical protein
MIIELAVGIPSLYAARRQRCSFTSWSARSGNDGFRMWVVALWPCGMPQSPASDR